MYFIKREKRCLTSYVFGVAQLMLSKRIFIHWIFVLLEGGVSSAAYKKWEKAAIAGVSLVADAAEHLERNVTDENVLRDQNTLGKSSTFNFLFKLL